MPATNGVLKAKSLTLQGSGANPDFKMTIENDVYKLNRGTSTLLTVAADELTSVVDNSNGTITQDKVTIGTNTEIQGDLQVTGALKINDFSISKNADGHLVLA